MKWMCENHEFKMAFNNHSYGNLLLYPFGYDYAQFTPEHDTFVALSAELVSQNGFADIISSELYPASGDSDDWMYTATPEKDRIFAFTPEIGPEDGGFWPSSSQIIPICQSAMYMNITAAHMVTKYASVRDKMPMMIEDLEGEVVFDLRRLGLEYSDFTVSIEPVSNNISFSGEESFIGLDLLEGGTGSIPYTLDNSIQEGDIIQYKYSIDNGDYLQFSLIVDKIYGVPVSLLQDSASDLDAWTNSDWVITTESYVSPPTSMTDSPYSNYDNNEEVVIELEEPLDLIGAESATLTFMARWNIEQGWDFAQCEISPDGGSSWIPQCGLYTVLGNNYQDQNQPVYDGVQNEWVQETISLSDYLDSDEVLIRFRLVSDGDITADGFFFDDVTVNIISTVGISEVDLSDAFLSSSMPNPTRDNTRIAYTLPQGTQNGLLTLRNYLGQEVDQYRLNTLSGQVEINTQDYPAGTYFYTLSVEGRPLETKQLIVLK